MYKKGMPQRMPFLLFGAPPSPPERQAMFRQNTKHPGWLQPGCFYTLSRATRGTDI
jgi:hypothetical protein